MALLRRAASAISGHKRLRPWEEEPAQQPPAQQPRVLAPPRPLAGQRSAPLPGPQPRPTEQQQRQQLQALVQAKLLLMRELGRLLRQEPAAAQQSAAAPRYERSRSTPAPLQPPPTAASSSCYGAPQPAAGSPGPAQ